MYKETIVKMAQKLKRIARRRKSISNIMLNFKTSCVDRIKNYLGEPEVKGKQNFVFDDQEYEQKSYLNFIQSRNPVTEFSKKLHTKEIHSGEFILVLTDIVDSTKKWENSELDMLNEIRWHHEIGEILIEKHNGYEIGREGDSFFVAFDDIKNAKMFSADFMHHFKQRIATKKDGELYLTARIAVMKAHCIASYQKGRYYFYGNDVDELFELSNNISPYEVKLLH